MARSLFDELRAQFDPPPQQQRLKPNFFAKFARFSWRRAPVIIAIWSVLFLVGIAVTYFQFAIPSEDRLQVPVMSAAGIPAGGVFDGLENLQTIVLGNRDPALLEDQLGDLVQTLRQKSEIYDVVFAPGEGDYYDQNDLLYRPTDEVKGRVDYALSLRPLFNAVAAAPSARSMATLVNEIAGSIDDGRDPQGVTDLLNASASAVAGLMEGDDRPVDWAKIADLDMARTSDIVTVFALPKPGQEVAARTMTTRFLAVLREASGTSTSLSQASGLQFKPKAAHIDVPKTAAGSIIGLVVAGLITAIALGRARLIVLVFLPPVILFPMMTAAVLALSGDLWLSFWPIVLGGFLCTSLMALHLVLAQAEQAQRRSATENIVMLAAQWQGPQTMWLALIMICPWLALLALKQEPAFTICLVSLCAVILGFLLAFTLPIAILRFLPSGLSWRARTWLVPAHRALFETGQWQLLSRLLAIAAVIGCGVVLYDISYQQPTLVTDVPVSIIANKTSDVDTAISRLNAFSEASAVRWLGTFSPDDADTKRSILKQLANQFPRITPVQSEPPADLRDQLDSLQESLRHISEAASTKPELKQAANSFRRSLALLAATSGDKQIRQLENRLFGGFNRLAERADQLASIPPMNLGSLPPELHRLFGEEQGPFRLEVTAAPGISSADLARTLEGAGFDVLHPAIKRSVEIRQLFNSVLRVLAAGLFLVMVIMAIAYRNVRTVLAAVAMMLATVVAAAAVDRLWQNEPTLDWMVGLLAVASLLIANIFLRPIDRGSTAASAVELFLLPLLLMAVALPLHFLDAGAIATELVPVAAMLLAAAVMIGLLQRHSPSSSE